MTFSSPPAGTPPDVIAKLAEGLNLALNDREIRRRVMAVGLQPAYLGPAAFATHIAHNFESYSRVMDDAMIKTE